MQTQTSHSLSFSSKQGITSSKEPALLCGIHTPHLVHQASFVGQMLLSLLQVRRPRASEAKLHAHSRKEVAELEF